MKRMIRANSQIGTYNGITYGQEDSGDQRYYFVDKYGDVHYADLEEELFAEIDNITASTHANSQLSQFMKWYSKLSDTKQDIVDQLADNNEIPLDYENATEDMLEWLREESEYAFREAYAASMKEADKEIPDFLKERPIVFELKGGNPTWSDAILRIAESHGAIRLLYKTINPKTGELYRDVLYRYAVPDTNVANEILAEVKDKGIIIQNNRIYPKVQDWTQAYKIIVDDYIKGPYDIDYHNYIP